MEFPKQEERKPTVDSNYIQQHLANERTYLAWLRTAIAVSGLGFLVANLLLAAKKGVGASHSAIAVGIGFTSVLMGIFITALATWSYLVKREEINTQTFKSPGILMIWVSLAVVLITLAIASYFLLYVLD